MRADVLTWRDGTRCEFLAGLLLCGSFERGLQVGFFFFFFFFFLCSKGVSKFSDTFKIYHYFCTIFRVSNIIEFNVLSDELKKKKKKILILS